MNKPKKLSFIERCVYFFDLRAYERRLHEIEKEFNQRNMMLQGMLIDALDENTAEERMLHIREHVKWLKYKNSITIYNFTA